MTFARLPGSDGGGVCGVMTEVWVFASLPKAAKALLGFGFSIRRALRESR
jgi:hypothetical protein